MASKEIAVGESTALSSVPQQQHSRHHSRGKHDSDPFFNVADGDLKFSDTSTPNDDGGNTSNSPPESVWVDFFLTPLNMISFIFSLVMIDQQQRQWRLSQHAEPESIWHRITHWNWLHPEPYQNPKDGTWGHTVNASGQTPDFSGFYTRKKHRAMAKMELSDAFEMRGRVVAALLVWLLLCAGGLTYAARRMYGWISS